VRIHYPFHPRAGQMVQVVHRKRFAGEAHLVVVQPDGTLALIPAWMAEETAGAATLTKIPRLSVGRLIELRGRIDALLASASGALPQSGGAEHASTTATTTRSEERKTPEVPAQLRNATVRLIEDLLVEALDSGSTQPAATTETKEAAHEQDHA
jgi:hypothetical protein